MTGLMRMLLEVVRDCRLAARGLWRSPVFTIVAVATLALGLALVAATIAVVNAYSVRSMPYPAADRLYHVRYNDEGQPEPGGMSALGWTELADIVEHADASTMGRFFIGDGAARDEVHGVSVARGSAGILGVRAALGRSLVEDDYTAASEPVALIGQELWRERFGGAADIVGRTIRAHRSSPDEPAETFRIIGVLPDGFRYAREQARGQLGLVVALRAQPPRSYMVRLREGVPVADAERRITDLARTTASSIPPGWSGVRLESVHERYVAGLRPVLNAIVFASVLVLVIVCLNMAVLLLLRSMRRQKEIAVRVALGGGRGHIARLLAAESGVLCGVALAAGVGLATIVLELLAPMIQERFGRDAPGGTSAIAVDGTVLGAIGAVGILIALALSAVPLLAPWQRRLGDTLRRGGRSGTDVPSVRRVRSALIVGEVALSLALLVGCGLMTRSVVRLLHTDLGFQTSQIVRARIALPQSRYPDTESLATFYERLTGQFSSRPDIRFALTNVIPFYEYPKQTVETGDAQRTEAAVQAVTESWFDLLGIGIARGRAFTNRDNAAAARVAIISESLAAQLWPGVDPIGARIRTFDGAAPAAAPAVWHTVIGVARDVRQTHTDVDRRDIYVSFLQAPTRFAPLYLQTANPAGPWLEDVRVAIGRIDPDVLVSGQVTGSTSLASEAAGQLAGPRFLMAVLIGFAAFAALLAMIGIYGVTGYALQQREREIAIRTAVGADRRRIILMIVRDGGVVLATGLAIGVAASLAVGRLLESQLYDVRPIDPATLLLSSVALGAAGIAATWWPARRATRSDPLESLRSD